MQLTGNVVPTWSDELLNDLVFELHQHTDPTQYLDLIDRTHFDWSTVCNAYICRAVPEILTELANHFDCISDVVFQVSKMNPGMVLPMHRDVYQTYRSRRGLDNVNSIRRIIIFLQDWQSGHYLEVDGIPYVNWRAGDWVSWTGATPHLAANLGSSARYTLQITGTMNA